MEPPHGGGGGSRAEAERWLVIAEKLLAGRDLVGSRTFAIRARESDPTLDASDQILAVAETLIAGEKRIGNLHDWYAVLQLPQQTPDLGLIATHYRQLAILLNPHRNRLPFADDAFKLVYDAWSILLNPTEKSMYDNELIMFAKYGPSAIDQQFQHYAPQPPLQQQQEQQLQPPQQPPLQPPQEPPLQPATQQEKRFQVQQQKKQQQVQKQQDDSRPSPKPKNVVERNVNEGSGFVASDGVEDGVEDNSTTFWTACPYCYNMYEYPRVYEDCSLRCQNCRRAFHGAKIAAPSPVVEGGESYFCCWGFFPLGVSMSGLEKDKGGVPNWTPFSPMFTCPQFGVDKNAKRKASVQKGPWIYIDDDDDAGFDSEEPSDDSDEDWRNRRAIAQRKKSSAVRKKYKKRKGKHSRRHGGPSGVRQSQRVLAKKEVEEEVVSGEELERGPAMRQAASMVAPVVPNGEISKKAAASSVKKQPGRVAKERGKLDLNVEFDNEVEEPPPGMTGRNKAGNGEVDGTEGGGFFEGLDEFLSSLPILNVVGAEKVKAT